MEQCNLNEGVHSDRLASAKRVWLLEEKDMELFPQNICLRFRYGALSTCFGEPLSFEGEEYLMDSLRRVHDLLGRVYFDGMPLEQFQSIQEKIREIERTNFQLCRSSDEAQKKELYSKCDSIWAEVQAEADKAVIVGLQQTERSI